MAKVTSKLQVTIPKRLAKLFGIAPGDEIEWQAAEDAIRLVPRDRLPGEYSVAERLKVFDQSTQRQAERQERRPLPEAAEDRGWRREELYERGRSR